MTQDNNTIKQVFPAQQREETVSGHQSQALEEQLFLTSGTNTSVTESHFHFRRGGQLSCQRRRDLILIMAARVSHPAEKTHPVDDWDVPSRLNKKNELTGRAVKQTERVSQPFV